ncbi:hypothetical protein ACJJTC_007253 [Scirpophaga incertulas]
MNRIQLVLLLALVACFAVPAENIEKRLLVLQHGKYLGGPHGGRRHQFKPSIQIINSNNADDPREAFDNRVVVAISEDGTVRAADVSSASPEGRRFSRSIERFSMFSAGSGSGVGVAKQAARARRITNMVLFI